MLPDPDDIVVTTGGQQAIDLVTKTLVDPGDVVICEAPTYPGAVPVFCSYQADVRQIEMDGEGMRIDLLEELLDGAARRRPAAEVHLHGADLPEPGRGDTLARAAGAAGRAGAGARAAGGRGQPLRDAPLRRRGAAAALPARRRRLRHLPGDVLEDPLPRDPARLGRGAAAGAGESGARQGRGRPLHLEPDPVLRPPVLRRRRLEELRRGPGRPLPGAPRHDAGGAHRALPGGRDLDRTRRRPLHLGDLARLHRHRRPAGEGAALRRGLRAGGGGIRRRAREELDAAELQRRRRRRNPRGDRADRTGDPRTGRALRDAGAWLPGGSCPLPSRVRRAARETPRPTTSFPLRKAGGANG